MRYGSIVFACFASLLLCVSLLSAQTGSEQVTQYIFTVYAVGTAAPSAQVTVQATDVACVQTAPNTTNSVNPDSILFDDKDNAGKVCLWKEPLTGTLLKRPNGNYTATVIKVNATGRGPESAAVPFSVSILALPSAATGVHLFKSAP